MVNESRLRRGIAALEVGEGLGGVFGQGQQGGVAGAGFGAERFLGFRAAVFGVGDRILDNLHAPFSPKERSQAARAFS